MTDKPTKSEAKPLPVLPGIEPIAICGVCHDYLHPHVTWEQCEEGKKNCPLHDPEWARFDKPADPSLLTAVHDLRQQRAALRGALIPFLYAYAYISDEKAGIQGQDRIMIDQKDLRLFHLWDARRVMKETEVEP